MGSNTCTLLPPEEIPASRRIRFKIFFALSAVASKQRHLVPLKRTHIIMNKQLFAEVVVENFQFLQLRYGFSAPTTEDFGREIFISYDRNVQSVSISYEYGNTPLIEIFYPVPEFAETSIPWASKNGVSRARRFPKLKLTGHFSEEEATLTSYIKEMSREFEKVESGWLNTSQS